MTIRGSVVLSCALVPAVMSLRGLEKKTTVTFQRCVILDT